MPDELWAGVEFKLAEAEFFLGKMGAVLLPPWRTDPNWHPSWGGQFMSRWQPDFFYYLDAFLAAARSIPDVIQKCFGWDPHHRSKKEWAAPPDAEEQARREAFQAEFTSHYTHFHGLPLSRVRVGTFHWLGVPSVQATARTPFGGEFKGGPLDRIPSAAPRQFLPGTDPALRVLFGQPLPVEPLWQHFTLEIPRDDGATESHPLFGLCRSYVEVAKGLVSRAKEICERVHGGSKLTAPPPVARENRA